MTIGEAIEIKQRYQYILQDASLPELIEADNLSIEALKQVRDCQSGEQLTPDIYLPGQTKD